MNIRELIKNKDFVGAREALLGHNVVDIAAELAELKTDELIKIFRLMPKNIASDIFSYLPIDTSRELISALSQTEAAEIINELFADDAADLLEEMPANIVKRILSSASAETRQHINNLLKYPDDSAGSVMTVEFVDLKKNLTVGEAIERIRKDGIDKETINTCYVLDSERKLIGEVGLRKILLSRSDEIIGDIMNDKPVLLHTLMDKEEVAGLFQKYDLKAMPVVDSENRLVGIITIDDVVDIIQEETSETMAKLAAVTPTDKPYLKTSILKIYTSRVPWLLILLISATFTGLIITANEAVLASGAFGIFLMASVPMLMDSGGNAGSQSNITVIRSLALNEIKYRDAFKVLWKELLVSVLLGLTLAAVCFFKLLSVDRLWKIDNGYMVAFVISISLFITIVVAKIVGCLMPFLAKKLRLDPAVVAAPFITTIVDAIALIIYCAIAISILP